MSKPVYHSNKVHVVDKKCSTCVFHPGNLMKLQPGRLKEIVDHNLGEGVGLTCHKTTFDQQEQEATCAGYYEAYGDQIQIYQVAERLGMIERVGVDGSVC